MDEGIATASRRTPRRLTTAELKGQLEALGAWKLKPEIREEV